jgi:hypothetical protein
VAAQRAFCLFSMPVPNDEHVVEAARHDLLAVWRKGDASDGGFMAVERMQQLAAGEIPHF